MPSRRRVLSLANEGTASFRRAARIRRALYNCALTHVPSAAVRTSTVHLANPHRRLLPLGVAPPYTPAGYLERYSGYRLTCQLGLRSKADWSGVSAADTLSFVHERRSSTTPERNARSASTSSPASPSAAHRGPGLVPAERTHDFPPYAPAPTHAGAPAHRHRCTQWLAQRARVANATGSECSQAG